MKKPHLLMIGGWTSLFEKAFTVGFDVSYIGTCKSSAAFDLHILQDFVNIRDIEINQVGLCLRTALLWHQQHPFDAVISFTELGMESAAVIANALNLPGLELDAVMLTRFKDIMRELLQQYPNLSLPSKRLSAPEHLKLFYSEHGPSVIVKPISGAASVGVFQIHSEQQLEKFLCNQPAIFERGYMVEKFVNSQHTYSVETLSSNGKHFIITMSSSKNVGQPYNLVDYTIVPPHDLPAQAYKSISDTVIEFLQALGLKNGVTHTEVKRDNQGRVFIIESQTRVGGDRIWKMAEMTSGFPQIELALRGLLHEISFPKLEKRGSAGFFCLLPPAGEILSVSDCGFLSDSKAVLEYEINLSPGQIIKPITDNTQRCGYLLAKADSHEQLFKLTKELYKKIKVEYCDGKIWQPDLA